MGDWICKSLVKYFVLWFMLWLFMEFNLISFGHDDFPSGAMEKAHLSGDDLRGYLHGHIFKLSDAHNPSRVHSCKGFWGYDPDVDDPVKKTQENWERSGCITEAGLYDHDCFKKFIRDTGLEPTVIVVPPEDTKKKKPDKPPGGEPRSPGGSDLNRFFEVDSEFPARRGPQCGLRLSPGPRIAITAIEFTIDASLLNRRSIFSVSKVEIRAVAGIENLDGYRLWLGKLYNPARGYTPVPAGLSFEDGVLCLTSEDIAFPIGELLMSGRRLPNFDYRIYTDKGSEVDIAYACYLGASDALMGIKDLEYARIERRSGRDGWWLVENAPSAPSSFKQRNLVGFWADLKR